MPLAWQICLFAGILPTLHDSHKVVLILLQIDPKETKMPPKQQFQEDWEKSLSPYSRSCIGRMAAVMSQKA